MELKDGKVNEEVREALDFFYKSKCDYFLHNFSKEKGEGYLKQLIRMGKQDYKVATKVDIINKEEGVDIDGAHIKIIDKEINLEYFLKTIKDLIKESKVKGWAIADLVGGLCVGVYSGNFPGRPAMEMWMKGIGINYPIFDFRQAFKVPCAMPPFLMPLGERNCFDIISGDTRIYFCLSFEKWFELARKEGLNMYWMGEKESARLKSSGERQDLININGRYIEYESSSGKMRVGNGILVRIFFELVTPKSVLKILKVH